VPESRDDGTAIFLRDREDTTVFAYIGIVIPMGTDPPISEAPSSMQQLWTWLSQGWSAALRHFPALVLIALIAEVPLTLLRAASSHADNAVLQFLFGLPAIALITPLAKAAAIVAINRWEHGQKGAVGAAFGALLRKFPLLLCAAALWAVAVFTGVALLVIPGVIVLILGQCLMGSIIIEGRSLTGAIRRSAQLVRPRFFAVLALFVIVQIVAGGVGALLQAGIGLLLTGWVLDFVCGALSSPFAFAPLAFLFLRSSQLDDAPATSAEGK
jgi:hypothetical protein